MSKRYVILIGAVLFVAAACSGESSTETVEAASAPATTVAAEATPATAAPTTSQATPTTATATTTTAAAITYAALSAEAQEKVDLVCFAAVVEGAWLGFVEITLFDLSDGTSEVPAFQELASEIIATAGALDVVDGKQTGGAMLIERAVPICEEIGWTP